MALDNIPTLGPGGFNGNLDKVLVYKNGGSEVACSLLTLTNSALNIAGVYVDAVNQRVGINNPNPVTALDVIGAGRFYQGFAVGIPSLFAYNGRAEADSTLRLDNPGGGKLYFGGFGLLNETNAAFGQLSAPSARVHIKGSGSTSATTSLLVQNSSGTTALNVNDAGQVCVGGTNTFGYPFLVNGNTYFTNGLRIDGSVTMYAGLTVSGSSGTILTGGRTVVRDGNSLLVGGSPGLDTPDASAAVEIRNTTKGFLNARVTTAQKNLIASPATGLMVYDTDLNRPCFFNGTSWITL